jgi:hypothetical protein
MTDREAAPGGSADKPSGEPDVMDEAREAALIREVLRAQERHREGGVERELDEAGRDEEPGTPT